MSSAFIPVGSTVLVTGINSYLGAHVALNLLQHGYIVRGTVRSQAKADAFAATVSPQQRSLLAFAVVDDITRPGAYEASGALTGVAAVCHLASPVPKGAVQDNERDVITPAVEGTLNVLRAAATSPAVRRVIVQSSIVAVRPASITQPGSVLTEQHWNETSRAEGAAAAHHFAAYIASKALSERAAWQFMDSAKPTFDLVTFCPPFFFGPMTHTPKTAADIPGSLDMFYGALHGKSTGYSSSSFIDIRDLAEQFVPALQLRQAGGERFLLSAGGYTSSDIAALAVDTEATLPATEPASLPYVIDYSKAEKLLGFQPRSKQQTFADTVHFLLAAEAQFPQVN